MPNPIQMVDPYQDNALWHIFYPPALDPMSQFPGGGYNAGTQFSNPAPANYILNQIQNALPAPIKSLTAFQIAVIAGIFTLTMIYFGTFIVRHT